MSTVACNDWRECDLAELIAVAESGQRPYGGVTEESGEIPSLGGENIRKDGGLELSVLKKVPADFYRAMTKGVLQSQDVLINKDGANTGKAGIYDGQFPVATINEHLFLLRGKPDRLAQRFLYRILVSVAGQRKIRAKISGSAQPGLKSDFIRNFPLRVPGTTAEQSRIAAVLDTVDEVIAKTEAVITKLKQVRAGLLHDLLTRGLDEHGGFRDPIAYPALFKDSPLGRIPKDWEVAPLGSFLMSTEYGISTSLDGEDGLPVLRMNNLAAGEAELTGLKYSTCDVPASLLLRNGDVLFNRTNSYEHVGRTGIWRAQLPVATFASYLVRLNTRAERLTSEFLNLLLNVPESQVRMRRFATPAVQQVNINPTSLQQMLVAIPRQLTEQDEITKMALQSASALAAEHRELTKLNQLKAGLMADLLSGRVRVPEPILARESAS